MIEQCEKCKHKESLGGGIVGCLYMGADCKKGEMFEAITNADRIRAMSDEELARLLYCSDSLGWCHNLPECEDMLDTDDGIPEEKCMACLVAWLKQPEEGT